MASTQIVIPNEILNNNTKIPVLGLASWGWTKTEPGSVTQTVKEGIDLGYRYIDTVPGKNEVEVGEAIHSKIKEGVVKREELYLVGKLLDPSAFHNPKLIMEGLLSTLRNLNVAYIDLYIINCPERYHTFDSDDFGEGNNFYDSDDFVDTWYEMEKLVDNFLVKSIGLSNFNEQHIEHLLAGARFHPVTNQLECHPSFTQQGIRKFCSQKHIPITAYNIYGSPSLMEEPLIVDLAKKYKKTPEQILLRYQIDKRHIAVPQIQSKSDLRNNLEIFKFKLDKKDIAALDKMDHKENVFL